jgi:DNA-binding NtrC family response regulator
MSRTSPAISEDAHVAMLHHDWPGNVRELVNLMERLCIYFPGKEVSAADLQLPARLGAAASPDKASQLHESDPRSRTFGSDSAALAPASIVLEIPETGTTFDALEKEILARILEQSQGNQSRAARALGLSESTFRSRLKRLGLKD